LYKGGSRKLREAPRSISPSSSFPSFSFSSSSLLLPPLHLGLEIAGGRRLQRVYGAGGFCPHVGSAPGRTYAVDGAAPAAGNNKELLPVDAKAADEPHVMVWPQVGQWPV